METGLHSYLSARLNHKNIYPISAPQDLEYPFIIYTRIDTLADITHDGASGLNTALIQVDCFGESYKQAKDLSLLVKGLLQGFRGTMGTTAVQGAFLQTELDEYIEPANTENAASETGIYKTAQQWNFVYED